MAGNQGNNRIVWQDWQINFLRDNYKHFTARDLAAAVGLKMTVVRMKLYEMGLKKFEVYYWTKEQEEYLIQNYKKLGDVELAEIYTRRWKKKGGWTEKHIAKKRGYLNLTRTKDEISNIRKRNTRQGRFAMCPVKAWETRGKAAEHKAVKTWRGSGLVPKMVIKINGRWRDYAPWFYREHIGPVPRGYIVRVKNGNPLEITKENLELVPRSANGPMNKKQTPEYKRERQKAILKFQIKRNEEQIIRLKQSPL